VQVTDTLDSTKNRQYTYDPLNRLTSVIDQRQVLVTPGAPGQGSVSVSGSERVKYVQECYYVGRTKECTNNPVYDYGNASVTVGTLTETVGYGQGSTSTSIASGLASAFNNDLNNRIVTASASASTVTLTATGNGIATNYPLSVSATSTDTQDFTGTSFSATTSGATLTGGTDPVYQGQNAIDETYSLDPWGNLQQSGNFNFVQSCNAKNQINGYSYDAAGNALADGLGNTFSYAADGLLASSSGVSYTYDVFDQRVRKDFSGSSLEYVYLNGTLLAEHNPTTGAWTDFIYAGDSLIAEVDGNQSAVPVYRIVDQGGSVAQLTDGSGNVLNSVDVFPYGQVYSGSSSDPILFATLERDAENGSDHAWFRQYSPAEGRWLAPDPYNGSYDLSDPQSFNRYAYVQGQPLSYIDPSGLFLGPAAEGGGVVCGPVCAALGAIGGGILDLFTGGLFGGGPSFHGSLERRPDNSFDNASQLNSSAYIRCPAVRFIITPIHRRQAPNREPTGMNSRVPGSASIDPQIVGMNYPGPEDQSQDAWDQRDMSMRKFRQFRKTPIVLLPQGRLPKGAPRGPWVVRGIGDANVRSSQVPWADIRVGNNKAQFKVTVPVVILIPRGYGLSCPK
jgi:RHS repeat-associated protein